MKRLAATRGTDCPDYAADLRDAKRARDDVERMWRHLRALEVNAEAAHAAAVDDRDPYPDVLRVLSRLERAVDTLGSLGALVTRLEGALARAQEGALVPQLEASVRAVADTEPSRPEPKPCRHGYEFCATCQWFAGYPRELAYRDPPRCSVCEARTGADCDECGHLEVRS